MPRRLSVPGRSDMITPKARQWAELVRLGLLPGVASQSEYEARVSLGMLRAVREVDKVGGLPNYDPAWANRIHRLIFADVHPWAGMQRKPGEGVMVGGRPGAHPDSLAAEQFVLIEQGMRLQAKPPRGWVNDGVARAAFLHARFERIHPFRDGNGRVGRVLLYGHLVAAAMERGTKTRPPLFDREEYTAALEAASDGDLTYLANTIRAAIGRPVEFVEERTTFSMAPTVAGPVLDDRQVDRGTRSVETNQHRAAFLRG